MEDDPEIAKIIRLCNRNMQYAPGIYTANMESFDTESFDMESFDMESFDMESFQKDQQTMYTLLNAIYANFVCNFLQNPIRKKKIFPNGFKFDDSRKKNPMNNMNMNAMNNRKLSRLKYILEISTVNYIRYLENQMKQKDN